MYRALESNGFLRPLGCEHKRTASIRFANMALILFFTQLGNNW